MGVGSRPPSRAAAVRIGAADDILVRAASVWELALLVDAGRLLLDRPVRSWVQGATRDPAVRQVPIDDEIAVAAVDRGSRGFHGDPADRFVSATAMRERATLVSKDTAVRSFAADDGPGHGLLVRPSTPHCDRSI